MLIAYMWESCKELNLHGICLGLSVNLVRLLGYTVCNNGGISDGTGLAMSFKIILKL
jgi:hypothetical protein